MRTNICTAALIASLAAGSVICAAPASAAMTSSNVQVTAPAGPYLTFENAVGTETLTVSGTTNGSAGEKVDINCYSGSSRAELAEEVKLGAGGSLSFSGSFLTLVEQTCVLRVVPHGFTVDQPPGTPSPFNGPTLGIGVLTNSTIASGANKGALWNYYAYASQATGAFAFRSLGQCPILESRTYDPVTFAGGSPEPEALEPRATLDNCNASLWWQNGANGVPGVIAPTRSELQVDGMNAYLPGDAKKLFVGAEEGHGYPALKYRFELDHASGNASLEESDQVVRCAPQPAVYPPTPVSCSSFVPTGVEAFVGTVQGGAGRLASVTQWFYSTDGRAHSVDLLEGNQFRHVKSDGELEFPWTGEGVREYDTAGQAIPAPPGGPGSLFIKGSASVPNGGEESPQGSLTFSNPPEGETIVESTINKESWVTLHYQRALAAGGAVALGFTYATGFVLAEVQKLAAAAQAAYAPSVTITAPAAGASTSVPQATVSGTAGDQTGLSSLVVDGHSVEVTANGTWSTTVPLVAGTNTVSATATNVFGNSAQTHASITYVPITLGLKGTPSASGPRGHRGVRFELTCQAAPGTSCQGLATLTSIEHRRGRLTFAISARKHARHRRPVVRLITVTVGQTAFSIPAGQTQSVFVPLNKTGLRLLALFHALPVALAVTLTNGAGGATLVANTGLLVTPGAKPHKKPRKRSHGHARRGRRGRHRHRHG
jgi:hypothetical protein